MDFQSLNSKRRISPPPSELSELRPPLTAGEKEVLFFFDRNLALDWEIYIQPHLNGLRPDFILLNPNGGIAVFEVKDWNLAAMSYDTKSPQIGKPELWVTQKVQPFTSSRIKNSVKQVVSYKDCIANLYCPEINNNCIDKSKSYFSLITAGVIFTTATTQELESLLHPFYAARNLLEKAKPYHPLAGSDAITADDLKTVFPSATRKRDLMQPEMADSLRRWLIEPDFSITQRQPLELNAKQRQLAANRTKSGYRRIRGSAGSGKSLVMAARAAHLSTEGKQVLVVSYNITLWHYLRDLAARYPMPGQTINKSTTWLHFHEWCRQVICNEAGLFNEYNALWPDNVDVSEVLETEIVALTNRAIDSAGSSLTTYDAILVDEGQDYNPMWWNTLRRVLREGGEMVLVADETQDLYKRARSWTEEAMNGAGFSGPWVQLDICYRLPPVLIQTLQDFAEKHLSQIKLNLPQAEPAELDLYPVQLRWVQLKSSDRIAEECVTAMLEIPGAANSVVTYADITLLVPTHRIGLAAVERLESQNFKVCHIFDQTQGEQRSRKMAFFMGDARIKACTIHSFKGWEARYIVIAITPYTDLEAAYVATPFPV